MPALSDAAPCPICDKPASAAHAPFCSASCRDRDLLQWLGDGYRLPGRAIAPAEDEPGLDSAGASD